MFESAVNRRTVTAGAVAALVAAGAMAASSPAMAAAPAGATVPQASIGSKSQVSIQAAPGGNLGASSKVTSTIAFTHRTAKTVTISSLKVCYSGAKVGQRITAYPKITDSHGLVWDARGYKALTKASANTVCGTWTVGKQVPNVAGELFRVAVNVRTGSLAPVPQVFSYHK